MANLWAHPALERPGGGGGGGLTKSQTVSPEANNVLCVLAPVVKFAGGHKFLDSQMEGCRLQVLPECHDVHTLHSNNAVTFPGRLQHP